MNNNPNDDLVNEGVAAGCCALCGAHYDDRDGMACLLMCSDKHVACRCCVQRDVSRCPICSEAVVDPAFDVPQLSLISCALHAAVVDRDTARADKVAETKERERIAKAYDRLENAHSAVLEEHNQLKQYLKEMLEFNDKLEAEVQLLKNAIPDPLTGDNTNDGGGEDSALSQITGDNDEKGNDESVKEEESEAQQDPDDEPMMVYGNIRWKSTGKLRTRRKGELLFDDFSFTIKCPGQIQLPFENITSGYRMMNKVTLSVDTPPAVDWEEVIVEFDTPDLAKGFISAIQEVSGAPMY